MPDSLQPHEPQQARPPCPPKPMSIESVMPSNHLILCCPLLLPSIFPSIRVFSDESALHITWPKYWSFNITPSNEYSELISFRMDWFDLLDVQHMWKDFNKAPSIVLGILASLSVFCQYLSYRLGVESLFSACHKASFALCPFCLWGRNYLYILRICKSLPSFLRHLPVSRVSSSACPEIYFLKSVNNTHFNFKYLYTSKGRLGLPS